MKVDRREMWVVIREIEEQALARDVLRREIAEAVADRAVARPYKRGDLVWGS
jgi:hypothetical protein